MFDNLEQDERALIRYTRETGITTWGILQLLYQHYRTHLSTFHNVLPPKVIELYEKRLETTEEYILTVDKIRYEEHEEEPIEPFVPWKD
jgi:hypothetical protein